MSPGPRLPMGGADHALGSGALRGLQKQLCLGARAIPLSFHAQPVRLCAAAPTSGSAPGVRVLAACGKGLGSERARQRERILLVPVRRTPGAVLAHVLPWPVVRHLCGLCFPLWGSGRGWTLLRPLLKDGKESGGRLTEVGGTVHHTDHRCPRWQEGCLWALRGPSGLRSPPACYRTRVSSRPPWPHLLLRGALPECRGRGHEDTEQDICIQLSIQAPATWAHTILPFSSERGSPEILAAGRGLWGVGWRPSSGASLACQAAPCSPQGLPWDPCPKLPLLHPPGPGSYIIPGGPLS